MGLAQGVGNSNQSLPLDYSQPKYYTIDDLTVTGTQHLDPKTLLAISGLKVGDEILIPGEDISKAIKQIWKQKLVADVQVFATKVTGNHISLNIQIKERPRLSAFEITGVKKGEVDELRTKTGFFRGQVVSDAAIKNAKRHIQRHYEEKGLYGTQVDISQIADPSTKDYTKLVVNVKKGKKVKIQSINISGNQKVSEKQIKKTFKNTKEESAFRVWKRSKYIKNDYRDDKEALLAYYQSLGMRDVEIVRDSVYQIDAKHVAIDMVISEGPKYYFRDITWSGNNIYTDSTLKKVLQIQKGDVYDKALMDSKLNFNPTGLDVSSLYLDNGYLFFSVNPVELRVDGDSIDVEMRIHEGDQATIGSVEIYGNTKTSDHVILREIRTLPGQKFSRSNLIRTQREIAQLGYFDPEQIQILPIPNPQNGTVDIQYHVVEKPSDQLQLSGGWGGGFGFVGTLGLVFNNFSLRNIGKPKTWTPLPSGDGQRLSLRMQANGRRYQSYSITFTEPWLGGRKPNALSVSLSHSVNNDLTSDGDDIEGFLQITNIGVNLARRLRWPDDWFTLSNGLSYMRYNVNNFTAFGESLCETCTANNINFNTTLARNSIGLNPQFPTQGSNISLSVSLTPPYSLLGQDTQTDEDGGYEYKWVEYNKWMFDFSQFLKLTGNRRKSGEDLWNPEKKEHPLVLNLRAHFGVIAPYRSDLEVSPFERFRLGGSGLTGATASYLLASDVIGLRGYDDGTVVPTGAVGGGVIYNKFVAELRFPVVMEQIATVYVLGFLEAGNNWGTYSEFNPYDLKRSYGAGLRVFMPAFGLLGFDYGVGIDDIPGSPNANGGQFHFTIGQQLR